MRNVLTIAAAALGVATASAQTQDPDALIPVNVSVRLGVGLPIDNDLRDFSNLFIGLGLEYKSSRSLLAGGETFFALDVFKGDRSDSGYVIPLTINQRFFTGNIGDGRRTYAFVGAGVGFLKGQNNWDTALAVRGGVGADLGPRIFAEGSLTLTDRANRAGFNGNLISLQLGYRF
ncbi:hypothetical protein EON82_00320 [bacterium]|nr:MAG: hypothetical protein EON82_00320 [bacterium]